VKVKFGEDKEIEYRRITSIMCCVRIKGEYGGKDIAESDNKICI
jgi:hypothetical protein